jgi:hypothetical protein
MSRSALLRSSLLASALLLLPASFAGADDLVKETANSEVTLQTSGDNFKVVVVNRRFETSLVAAALDSTRKNAPGISGDGIFYQLLMIEETHEATEGPTTETEEGPTKVKVTAYALSKAGKGAVRFTIEADGNSVKTDGPYLTIARFGVDNDSPTYAVYSLETGAYLFNATGEGDSGQWATMGSEGGWKSERVVSSHVTPTAADDTVLAGAPNAAAVINYATSTNAIQHVLVTVPKQLIDDDKPIDWLPKIDLISKDQPKGDENVFIHSDEAPEKAYDGVVVRLALDDKTVITVPIKGDRLDIAHAKLPQGFALEEQPIKNVPNQ